MPQIIRSSLFFRSGYFIDNLKSMTNLGFNKLEEAIRDHQYNGGKKCVDPYLLAPPKETIRDYFRLYRPVAFEPNEKATFAPWLLAAELEYPGCSNAFFHPIFDLLFGQIESSNLWTSRFRSIPKSWIKEARERGDEKIAGEWELMNKATLSRKHRTKPSSFIETLSLAHLSMLRLPNKIKDALLDKNDAEAGWVRKYSQPEIEISHLQSIKTMESLAAMLALAIEAAAIGDLNRLTQAKSALLEHMNLIDDDPACKRIGALLKKEIIYKCDHTLVRSYNGYLNFGFGLPVSWRALAMDGYLLKSADDLKG